MLMGVFIIVAWITIVFFKKKRDINKSRFYFLGFLFIVSLSIVLIFCGLRKGQQTEKTRSTSKISEYFESIRDNEAELTTFFQAMPKGGDLHNHYGGSLYAEHMLDNAISNKYWINRRTLKVDVVKSSPEFLPLDSLSRTDSFGLLRQRIYQDWSIKDYYDALQGTDQHFFDSFDKMPKETKEDKIKGVQELLDRANAEHVSYLELMTSGPNYAVDTTDYRLRFSKTDADIRRYTKENKVDSIDSILGTWYQEFSKNGKSAVDAYHIKMKDLYDALKKDCAIRFLIQGYRETRPANLFRTLTLGFMVADKDPIIIGVNIVQREDGPVSMQDYKLHMQMFRFLHEKLKDVRYTMHAGELTLGSVPPEDLTFHIHDAVFTAGAQRIGHGVDIPFEANQKELLGRMREKKVAIEINLWSNEYILKVSGDKHPIMLYFKAGVPIVICTDDAGILRSSMTHQYVLLAMRYKDISYDDIKQFIRNSIEYSFISDKKLKDELLDKLEDDMKDFERTILK